MSDNNFDFDKQDKSSNPDNMFDQTLYSFIDDNNSRNNLHKYFKIILIIIFCILLWSIVASMEQTVQIQGLITPQSGISKIKHETGGDVTKIHVKDYQSINKSDPLVTIDDTKHITALKQYKSKLKVVDTEIAHAVAYLKDNLSKITDEKNLQQVTQYLNNISDTVSHSAHLTAALKQVSDNQDEVIKSQIQKNKIEIAKLADEIEVLEEELVYLDEQRKIFNKLLETRNVSKIQAMNFEIKYREVLRDYKKAKADHKLKQKETTELNSKRIVQQQDTIREKYQELITLNKEKIDVISNINQLENTLKNLDIKSPIDGIVQGINVVVGSNIQPGDEILSIVPSDSDLVFEAKASLKQKGKIDLDSKAEVQFDGFNVLRFNRVQGKILNISPYTFNKGINEDEYVKVVVKLDDNKLSAGNSEYKIKPGMSGTLYVTTDKQSIFAYLFGPIYGAFSEIYDEK